VHETPLPEFTELFGREHRSRMRLKDTDSGTAVVGREHRSLAIGVIVDGKGFFRMVNKKNEIGPPHEESGPTQEERNQHEAKRTNEYLGYRFLFERPIKYASRLP
jgi:hypothetical protein